MQELDEPLDLGRALLHLLAGVHVLGVLAEDHHVDLLRMLHRGRHAREPADGAEADVEVEDLAQGDVQAADATADRRGERALDADEVLAEGGDRLFGKPVSCGVERLLPGEHLFPFDLPATLGDGGVDDALGRGPDVHPGAVTLDERDDGLVGNLQGAVGTDGDLLSHRRSLGRHWPRPLRRKPTG